MNLGELVFAPGMQYLPLCGLLSGPSSVDCGGGSRALRDAVGGRAGLPAAMEPGPSGRRVADGRLQSLGCCGHDRLQIAFVMACARRPLQPLHEQPVAVARQAHAPRDHKRCARVQGELPGSARRRREVPEEPNEHAANSGVLVAQQRHDAVLL